MAVAVKNSPEVIASGPVDRLPVWSLLGVLYDLAGIGLIFYLYPLLWAQLSEAAGIRSRAGSFVDTALLLLGMMGLAGGYGYVGYRLVSNHPPHGLKAGVFVGLLLVVAVALLTWAVAAVLEGMVYRGWLNVTVG